MENIHGSTATTLPFVLKMSRKSYLMSNLRKCRLAGRRFRLAMAGVLAVATCGCGSPSGMAPAAHAQTAAASKSDADVPENPYPQHIPAPPLPAAEWVNTPAPLSLADLRG